MRQIIECVPNFSEGRNQTTIQAIASAIQSTADVQLLNIDPNEAANRTVYTFIGSPEAVCKAAFEAIRVASQLIDMRMHTGVHPRIGACDVCPLIPIQNISLDELNLFAQQLASRVASELLIPVYCYEHSARYEHRTRLEQIRKGQYEGLQAKMQQPEWYPDYGSNQFNAQSGASVIGVRNFLIAYNIDLETQDIQIARDIAALIRTSGGLGRKQGMFAHLKAIGWYVDEFDKVQISTNITNYNITPLHAVYEAVDELAQNLGTSVTGSELVGLIPYKALYQSGSYFIEKTGEICTHTHVLEKAVDSLGLNDVKPFIIRERVLEFAAGLMEYK